MNMALREKAVRMMDALPDEGIEAVIRFIKKRRKMAELMPKEKLDMICAKVADCYRRAFGDKLRDVYLYGSYARGDCDEESDIDFVAIVDEEQLPMQEKLKQTEHEMSDFDLEHDIVTSMTAIPASRFDEYKDREAYYMNIMREGRKIA